MKEESRPHPVEGLFKAGVASLAILAYFAQPLLPYADIYSLMAGACFLAGGVFVIGVEYRASTGPSRMLLLFALAMVLVGGLLIAWTFNAEGPLILANDKRCLAIEIDMLQAAPRIRDGPALFQAFRCRPQTDLAASPFASSATAPVHPVANAAPKTDTAKQASSSPAQTAKGAHPR